MDGFHHHAHWQPSHAFLSAGSGLVFRAPPWTPQAVCRHSSPYGISSRKPQPLNQDLNAQWPFRGVHVSTLPAQCAGAHGAPPLRRPCLEKRWRTSSVNQLDRGRAWVQGEGLAETSQTGCPRGDPPCDRSEDRKGPGLPQEAASYITIKGSGHSGAELRRLLGAVNSAPLLSLRQRGGIRLTT